MMLLNTCLDTYVLNEGAKYGCIKAYHQIPPYFRGKEEQYCILCQEVWLA